MVRVPPFDIVFIFFFHKNLPSKNRKLVSVDIVSYRGKFNYTEWGFLIFNHNVLAPDVTVGIHA